MNSEQTRVFLRAWARAMWLAATGTDGYPNREYYARMGVLAGPRGKLP